MTCNDSCTEDHGGHIHVEVIYGDFTEDEIKAYVQRAKDLVKAAQLPEDLCRITLEDVGEGEVDIKYYRPNNTPIERIRRITGYLTGTLATWNDAKQAEEHDRVKHMSRETFQKADPCDTCEKDRPEACEGCPDKKQSTRIDRAPGGVVPCAPSLPAL